MSFLIYLLIFLILPYFSTSLYIYGKIPNATIKIPFDISDNYGHKLEVDHCNKCLCDAFGNNNNVYILTCTENFVKNFTCQFYYFMPKRDEIIYPINNTDIYLFKNETFQEKDDCCNTTHLIETIKTNSIEETNFIMTHLRSLVFGDNNTIATVTSDASKQFRKYDKLTLKQIHTSCSQPFHAVGYNGDKYYFSPPGTYDIKVYNETCSELPINIPPVGGFVTTIRFLNEYEMLVGASTAGVYIYKINYANGTVTQDRLNLVENFGEQLHAIGIVNETAFYIGWAAQSGKNKLLLYTKDDQGKWNDRPENRIDIRRPTSDIIIDKCGRIWAVIAEEKSILIYDKNLTHPYEIQTKIKGLFNLLILEDYNYTLITSHESDGIGLTRIKPSIYCRP